MKPPDSFIKYLQANPAVWEALQEEKKNLGWHSGDWFILTHRGEQEINCVGTMAQDRDWLVWVKEAGKYRDILWVPDLGQLVRMLQEAITQKDWETVPYLDVRWAEITLYFPSKEVAACVLGERADGETLIAFIGTELLDTGCREEPEIACAALWAKVKGVE